MFEVLEYVLLQMSKESGGSRAATERNERKARIRSRQDIQGSDEVKGRRRPKTPETLGPRCGKGILVYTDWMAVGESCYEICVGKVGVAAPNCCDYQQSTRATQVRSRTGETPFMSHSKPMK